MVKFTCDISTRISEIKKQIDGASTSFQKTNLESKIASLANVLIMLKISKNLRLHFFRFALKQNQKI